MQYIAETREFQIKEKTVVSIGKFDGLHRGHQKLMHEMLKWKEQGFKIAVFTFATPPGTLVKGKMQTMIMTNPEREMWTTSWNTHLMRKYAIWHRRSSSPTSWWDT